VILLGIQTSKRAWLAYREITRRCGVAHAHDLLSYIYTDFVRFNDQPENLTLKEPLSRFLLPKETKKYLFVGSKVLEDTFPPAPRPQPSLSALQEQEVSSLLHIKIALIEFQRPLG